jgi:RimJ/RimL family protein N-acetyltransferase
MKRIVPNERDRVGAWVAERVGRRAPWGEYQAIGLEEGGKLIAGVVIDGYVDGARCSMHVAGEGRKWLNREYLWFCFHYVFEQLRCKVVIGLVDADNEAALRFDQHLGFVEVCRIAEGAGDCDLVVLEMRRQGCRWLKLKRG